MAVWRSFEVPVKEQIPWARPGRPARAESTDASGKGKAREGKLAWGKCSRALSV